MYSILSIYAELPLIYIIILPGSSWHEIVLLLFNNPYIPFNDTYLPVFLFKLPVLAAAPDTPSPIFYSDLLYILSSTPIVIFIFNFHTAFYKKYKIIFPFYYCLRAYLLCILHSI